MLLQHAMIMYIFASFVGIAKQHATYHQHQDYEASRVESLTSRS